MSHSQISLKTSWGDTIYGNAWTIETPIANIVIAHGMGEYSYRYNEFANYLNSLGYNVYAVDQPGHGLNVTVPETPVVLFTVGGLELVTSVKELLPYAFSKENL